MSGAGFLLWGVYLGAQVLVVLLFVALKPEYDRNPNPVSPWLVALCIVVPPVLPAIVGYHARRKW